ncbi:MAG: PEP-CTERM sorting domain-containing protein [Pseudomonadota bacterium]
MSDGAGNALANFTITTGSGRAFPVAASIPEPESYAMMLAGLGLLGFFARRKKQQTT